MQNPYLFELTLYLKNGYPPFVTQKNPEPVKKYIPVFISHKVTENDYEEKLIFLKQNNYKSIAVTNLYSLIKEKLTPSHPTICLTFDDGHKSLYTAAYPLLKKYGFTATAFIVPAFIGNKNWITWEQADEMSQSGVIDIQSHTLDHKKIFVSDKMVTVNHSDYFKNELGLDRPSVLTHGRESTDIPMGAPIYEMDSRMNDRPRFLGTRYETKEEQTEDIKTNLLVSKKILEEKLNKPIEHLAYPWGIGSPLSQNLSKQTGFLTNFWGPIPGLPCNDIEDCDLYKLVRLKDDYVFRLTGQGRKSLYSIFTMKLKRRKDAKERGGDIY